MKLVDLTSDADLAAFALENSADICPADYDFKRFRCIKHVNPLR